MPTSTLITSDTVYQCLKTVIDPELGIDIVSLGLIYDVTVREIQKPEGPQPFVHVLMTLTTPGCPLIGVLDQMIKDSLHPLGLDSQENSMVELTFDPPWIPDMMTEEARAELGL